jgi:uncharacterized membrane protein HdeD (DUF308 family)
MPAMHSNSMSGFMLLWGLGIACCAIGAIFLYKAFACKRLSATHVAESRANVYPMWLGKTISLLLGLTAIAFGVGVIVKMLKRA